MRRTTNVTGYTKKTKHGRVSVRPHRRRTMSQSNLVKEVSEKTKIPQSEVKTVYNQLFKSSADHLKRGHGVKFQGLGIMNVKNKKATKARIGRNPFTGENIKISAKPRKKIVKFRISKGVM